MKITFDLRLDDRERRQLASALGADEERLAVNIRPYARAALLEYVRMFLDQMPTRVTDFREYRLLLLIQEVFDGKIPSVDQVSSHFRLPPAQAGRLIRSVVSKFPYELGAALRSELADAVQRANQRESDEYCVVINNPTIVEELNRILASHDGSLPRVAKKAGTVCEYRINVDSYHVLREHFQLPGD